MNDPEAIQTQLRTGRLLTLAMGVGVLALALIALVKSPTGQLQVGAQRVLMFVLLGLTVAVLPALLIITTVWTNALRRAFEKDPPEEDPTVRVARSQLMLTITRGAVAEGLGLLAGVVYLLTANALAVVGVALSLSLLALNWPTREKLSAMVSSTTSGRWR